MVETQYQIPSNSVQQFGKETCGRAAGRIDMLKTQPVHSASLKEHVTNNGTKLELRLNNRVLHIATFIKYRAL
jgi:hypothetical protein